MPPSSREPDPERLRILKALVGLVLMALVAYGFSRGFDKVGPLLVHEISRLVEAVTGRGQVRSSDSTDVVWPSGRPGIAKRQLWLTYLWTPTREDQTWLKALPSLGLSGEDVLRYLFSAIGDSAAAARIEAERLMGTVPRDRIARAAELAGISSSVILECVKRELFVDKFETLWESVHPGLLLEGRS